jgi:hypothetical protein
MTRAAARLRRPVPSRSSHALRAVYLVCCRSARLGACNASREAKRIIVSAAGAAPAGATGLRACAGCATAQTLVSSDEAQRAHLRLHDMQPTAADAVIRRSSHAFCSFQTPAARRMRCDGARSSEAGAISNARRLSRVHDAQRLHRLPAAGPMSAYERSAYETSSYHGHAETGTGIGARSLQRRCPRALRPPLPQHSRPRVRCVPGGSRVARGKRSWRHARCAEHVGCARWRDAAAARRAGGPYGSCVPRGLHDAGAAAARRSSGRARSPSSQRVADRRLTRPSSKLPFNQQHRRPEVPLRAPLRVLRRPPAAARDAMTTEVHADVLCLDHATDIAELVKEQGIKAKKTPGAAVLVLRHGKILHMAG